VQFWAPDDGRKNSMKHVERLTEINKLWNVASCWLYCANMSEQSRVPIQHLLTWTVKTSNYQTCRGNICLRLVSATCGLHNAAHTDEKKMAAQFKQRGFIFLKCGPRTPGSRGLTGEKRKVAYSLFYLKKITVTDIFNISQNL